MGARKAPGTTMAGRAVERVRAAPALSPLHRVLPASALHRFLPQGTAPCQEAHGALGTMAHHAW